jgi:hypothetical protein
MRLCSRSRETLGRDHTAAEEEGDIAAKGEGDTTVKGTEGAEGKGGGDATEPAAVDTAGGQEGGQRTDRWVAGICLMTSIEALYSTGDNELARSGRPGCRHEGMCRHLLGTDADLERRMRARSAPTRPRAPCY